MQIKKLNSLAVLLCGIGAGCANLAWAGDKVGLLTMDDTMMGISISQYNYREPNMIVPTSVSSSGTVTYAYSDVKQSGGTYGIHGEKTWALEDRDFLRFDVNFQGGKTDYNGSGYSPNETVRFYEMRLVYGVDEEFSRGVLATYAGLGYRYLYNDARAATKLGKTVYQGYEREQQYTYIPVGVNYKTLWNNKRLTLNAEAGLLISGSNRSHSDTMNFNFTQRSGFEARLGASLNQGKWDIGPYVHYWRVNDSEMEVIQTIKSGNNTTVVGYVEPRNTTVDVGIKIDRHF